MGYSFEKLPQLVDMRGKLPSNGSYVNVGVNAKTTRVWHHSLTNSDLAGSTAEAFARFHVTGNGWPGIGYHFVVEPKNLIKGPDGRMRARIVWAHDPGVKSYHVGNSNKQAVGICVAGDYRSEKLAEATLLTISELHAAFIRDGIGKEDKAHNEMPGYSWKPCCVFDYRAAFYFNPPVKVVQPAPLPGEYVIQEGDTFFSIAGQDGPAGITTEDLIAANPDVDPRKLKVGQVIKLGKAKNAHTPVPGTPKKPQETYKYPLPAGVLKSGAKGEAVKQLQRALDAVYFKSGVNDGSYGPKTVDAVKRFQMVYLPYEVDGVYGPNTRKRLQAVLKSKGY
ncbi:peptidoglycan-binding protein [Fictibacillus aquaticus]|uniref:LysM domain-containing protein n=1 Tax=Fictibacillus aquaticus TaxID=2021314 RepID=A0A235FA42_9BACL|nr:peptidoglycan-binding protein [Fictibacillus aquaticus]OYD57863.1 hypothetical protein CGZ90_08145 [Fictibacillus aquaticus]